MRKYLPLLLLVILFSCKKEAVDHTRDLLSRSWKMTARIVLTPFEGTPLEGYSNDWYSPGTCYSDMTWTYQRNGTFINEPAGSCVPGTSSGIDTLYGKWTLIDSKTIKVDFTNGGFADFEFTIIELTPAKMIVQRLEHTGIGGAEVSDYQEMDLLNQYEFVPK